MKQKLKMRRSSGNVFADLGFSAAEAHSLQLRATLMNQVEKFVTANRLTQRAAAARLGVSAPRLNDLMRGKIEKFSLDALVEMLARVGVRVDLRITLRPTLERAA